MAFLVNLIYWETLFLVYGLVGLVVASLASGGINTNGLLFGTKGDGTTYLSPERVQLLLITLVTAFQYLQTVAQNPTILPPVDGTWLALLGGSHIVYLGGKLGAALLKRPA